MTPNKPDRHFSPREPRRSEKPQPEHTQNALRLRAGVTCPRCQAEKLDYNGMLQLACPRCGVLETGCYT